MSTFVAIIGNRNFGKSTIIKSLTGCPTGQFRGTMTDSTTGRSIEVIGSSPQEKSLSLPALRALLKRGLKGNCNGIVCALQPSHPRKRLSLEDVLQEDLSFGYTVHSFVLDPGNGGKIGDFAGTAIRLPPGTLPPIQLDAGRFAHLNASIIQGYTSIAA